MPAPKQRQNYARVKRKNFNKRGRHFDSVGFKKVKMSTFHQPIPLPSRYLHPLEPSVHDLHSQMSGSQSWESQDSIIYIINISKSNLFELAKDFFNGFLQCLNCTTDAITWRWLKREGKATILIAPSASRIFLFLRLPSCCEIHQNHFHFCSPQMLFIGISYSPRLKGWQPISKGSKD